MNNCKILSTESKLNSELKLAILRKAAQYQKSSTKKNKRKYKLITPGESGRSK